MPDKLRDLQQTFIMEAAKYNVLPLDDRTLPRFIGPKPSYTPGRTLFTYSGELTDVPLPGVAGAPNVLNKSYTITAEVEVPQGGAEGMLVTDGGRFSGYGFYSLKGQPVFTWNLIQLERVKWQGKDALGPGKHTLAFDWKYDGPGLGKGGTGTRIGTAARHRASATVAALDEPLEPHAASRADRHPTTLWVFRQRILSSSGSRAYSALVADDPRRDESRKANPSGGEPVPPAAALSDPVGTGEMLAAIVESSDDAIVSKDLTGIITSWNRGAERVFGYTAEEAVGRSITMLLPRERLPEEATIVATLVRGERSDHCETERITKSGRRIPISLSVSPIRDRSGRVIGGAKIARDITLRQQLEQQREKDLVQEQQRRSLAEAANRAKDDFLAMVSHELRAPLSPILSWARLLRMRVLDEAKSDQALETIERRARVQAKLIDDLLDISRIVAGKLRLEVQSVDLASVIEQAVEVARPAADAKQIRVEMVLDTETGPVSGDPARLQQVVWNLLSNAVKFTPKGGRVQIALERVNSHVEIAISDTGRGVSAEFLPHLFERFQQGQSGTTRSPGGLGLGLAIVRHIVELHGGTVFAESAGEGQGATFTVKLPRTIFRRTAGESERRHPTVDPLPEQADLPSLDHLRVLVVDDEPDSKEVVSTVLGAAGAQVRVAASAAEGLEQLEQWTPHIIVSDIGMPSEDGFMFLARLHALPGEVARIPAVALTAYSTTADRVRIFSAGFRAHVVKPIDPVELVVVVANVAGSHGQSWPHRSRSAR